MNLIEVDLEKTTRKGSADLRVGPTYLCRIRGKHFVGVFYEQWYGLNFAGWNPNPAGLQYDPPGTNSSGWEKVWLLDDTE